MNYIKIGDLVINDIVCYWSCTNEILEFAIGATKGREIAKTIENANSSYLYFYHTGPQFTTRTFHRHGLLFNYKVKSSYGVSQEFVHLFTSDFQILNSSDCIL